MINRPAFRVRPCLELLEDRTLMAVDAFALPFAASAAAGLASQALIVTEPVDLFLRIAGVEGDSADENHKDEIELTSFGWGERQVGAKSGGGGGGAGKVSVENFHFLMESSSASPLLMEYAGTGRHVSEAVLSVRRTGETEDFLVWRLRDVTIGSYQTRALNENVPLDEIGLRFERLTEEYRVQQGDGSLDEVVVANWDLRGGNSLRSAGGDLLASVSSPSVGGEQFFLRWAGIEGDSTDEEHKDEIEVVSFGWGLAQAGTAAGGGGAGAGKVAAQDFHVVVNLSSASPQFLQAVANGERFPDATLSARRTGEERDDYLRYQFRDLFVSSYHTRAVNNGDVLDEITFSFARAEQQFLKQQGGPGDDRVSGRFDVGREGATDFTPGVALLPLHIPIAGNHDVFLKLDGIEGESADEDHKDEIEVLSFGWGISVESRKVGGGGGGGSLTVEDFHVIMNTSLATPQLLRDLTNGRRLRAGQLVVRADGEERFEFLRWSFQDIGLTSQQTRVLNEGEPFEELAFQAKLLEEEVFAQDDGGGDDATRGRVDLRRGGDGPSKDATPAGDSLMPTVPVLAGDNDLFLFIDGVQGDSTDESHRNEIAVESFGWGIRQVGGNSGGGGGGAGKAFLQDFHFVMSTSRASPVLMQAAANGQHFRNARLVMRDGGEEGVEFLRWTFDDIAISSLQTRTGPAFAAAVDAAAIDAIDDAIIIVPVPTPTGPGEPLDELAIGFRRLTLAYTPRDDDSGAPPETFTVDARAIGRDLEVGPSLIDKTIADNAAGVQMFLKVDGIPGESTDESHRNEIVVEAFGWGVSNASALSVAGGGGGSGKPVFQDFHIVMKLNMASPAILLSALGGRHIRNAELTVRKEGGDEDDYLKWRLEDIVVQAYDIQSTRSSAASDPIDAAVTDVPSDDVPPPIAVAGVGEPIEEIALSYGRVREEFHTPSGAVISGAADARGLKADAGGKLLPAVQHFIQTAPTEMFLRLEGIKGESTDEDHRDELVIDSFQWGIEQTARAGGGGGGGAGKVVMRDFQFTYAIDKADPRLLLASLNGQHLPRGVLSVRKVGEATEDYFTMDLRDVLVSSYHTSGKLDSLPAETLGLNFSRLVFTYRPQATDGELGREVRIAWDFGGNRASATAFQAAGSAAQLTSSAAELDAAFALATQSEDQTLPNVLEGFQGLP